MGSTERAKVEDSSHTNECIDRKIIPIFQSLFLVRCTFKRSTQKTTSKHIYYDFNLAHCCCEPERELTQDGCDCR